MWGAAALMPTDVSPRCAPSTAIYMAGDTNPSLRWQFWALPNAWFALKAAVSHTHLVPPVVSGAKMKTCAPQGCQGFNWAGPSSRHMMREQKPKSAAAPEQG